MAARGKIGGFSRAAKYPSNTLTLEARKGFMARFEPQEPGLSQEEFQRRTEASLKAHMARLSRLSALARSK
jgi:hypothetical protein